jgi:hypothetical protein
MFFIVDLATILKKEFPFPLTPAKLLGNDQTTSNCAASANTSFLLITCQYIGATNQIAPMYSIGAANM